MERQMSPSPDTRIPAAILDRRAVVTGGIAAAALGAFGRNSAIAIAQGSETIATPDQLVCVLTPEQTAGPFYVDDALIREDITDGQPGLPLELAITVVDTEACQPLPEVAVDIWHCDAQGYYSGVQGASPGGNADPAGAEAAASGMFFRGTQLTGADGVARFTTIYPGWYQGRTVHIHLKVIAGGAEGESYDGGTDIHTGQIYFDDAISDEVFATQPAYAGRANEQRTRNDQDGILAGHEQEPGFFIELAPVDAGDLAQGYTGTITVGVRPA
jgi:protocatechuate 3,4-dioxygenase beta subunit